VLVVAQLESFADALIENNDIDVVVRLDEPTMDSEGTFLLSAIENEAEAVLSARRKLFRVNRIVYLYPPDSELLAMRNGSDRLELVV